MEKGDKKKEGDLYEVLEKVLEIWLNTPMWTWTHNSLKINSLIQTLELASEIIPRQNT